MAKRKRLVFHSEDYKKSAIRDIPAGLVIFLVAVPLCLGIALASGAPMMSGILAAISGAIIIPLISKSQLSVSGPAAGLTAIVLSGIEQVGGFDIFLISVIIGGVVQMILSVLNAGYIAYFFPNAVIKGMLSAIGITLIIKQVPVAMGAGGTSGLDVFVCSNMGSIIISLISLAALIFWDRNKLLSKIYWLPGALVVVLFGVVLNALFLEYIPLWTQIRSGDPATTKLVDIPDFGSLSNVHTIFTFPNWSKLFVEGSFQNILIIGVTIGLVASIESLLTVEAVDRLDPFKRKTPLNRELLAQGLGNIASGFMGGLPVTSVIVRSSAGINAGAKTKMATVVNGMLTVLAVLFLIPVVNMIPTASLASILLVVGYKLAKPMIFKEMYHKGVDQFVPFVVTIIAILVFNLLIGIIIGVVVGIGYIIKTDFHAPITVQKFGNAIKIKFTKDISFMNKAILNQTLERIPEGSKLIIDARNAQFIHQDIIDIIEAFRKESQLKSIHIEFQNMERSLFSKNPFIFSLRNDKD